MSPPGVQVVAVEASLSDARLEEHLGGAWCTTSGAPSWLAVEATRLPSGERLTKGGFPHRGGAVRGRWHSPWRGTCATEPPSAIAKHDKVFVEWQVAVIPFCLCRQRHRENTGAGAHRANGSQAWWWRGGKYFVMGACIVNGYRKNME